MTLLFLLTEKMEYDPASLVTCFVEETTDSWIP